jgi:hypothetical protein
MRVLKRARDMMPCAFVAFGGPKFAEDRGERLDLALRGRHHSPADNRLGISFSRTRPLMNARAFASRSIAIAFGALALAIAPARGQDVTAPRDTAVAPSPNAAATAERAAAGPSVETASVAVRRTATTNSEALPSADISRNTGLKWMVVGGAAILTGVVVGGDAGYAISIGGAVIGLIGLYNFLQ